MNRLNQKRMNEALKYIMYSGEVLDYIKRTESRTSPLRKKLQEGITMLGGTIDLLQDLENKIKKNVPLEEEVDENSETTSEEN